jgi:glycosyltransferase involved in cell wall biosynthesis
MTERLGLLCFGGFARHDWALLWQRQQAVMTRMARHFEVFYIERFGTKPLPLAGLSRAIVRRIMTRRGHAASGEALPEGFHFINPHVAPFHGTAAWRRRNFDALVRAIDTAWPPELARGVLWIYNPSYVALEYLDQFGDRFERTVYDCVQRFEHNVFYPPDIGEIDRAIVERVDLVFTDSRTILQDKLPLNAASHHIPQGVDVQRFLWTGENRATPDDLRWIARPILGYLGAWHQAFDERFVCAALDGAPGSRFVFVGPTFGHEKRRNECRRNAIFLGPRDHAQAGRYVNAFDVCLIPYRLDEHSEGVFPTKFFEYAATGLPIVSTDLPDLRPYDDWTALARTPEEFAARTRAAARQARRPPEVARRFVEPHSWDRRVDRMLELMRNA